MPSVLNMDNLSTRQAGTTIGPVVVDMPLNAPENWQIQFTRDDNAPSAIWPDDKNLQLLNLVVEETNDGGIVWQTSFTAGINGGKWTSKVGNIEIFTTSISVTPLFRGDNCKLRYTIAVLQRVRIGIAVLA